MSRIVPVTEAVVMTIHKAIHNPEIHAVVIDGVDYPVEIFKKKWRGIRYGNIFFVEQNQDKPSQFTSLAKAGHRITWGMREGRQPWIYTVDSETHLKPHTFTTLKD